MGYTHKRIATRELRLLLPTHVRVSQYRYAFVEPDNGTEAVWTREPRRVLVRPVGAEALREALRT